MANGWIGLKLSIVDTYSMEKPSSLVTGNMEEWWRLEFGSAFGELHAGKKIITFCDQEHWFFTLVLKNGIHCPQLISEHNTG